MARIKNRLAMVVCVGALLLAVFAMMGAIGLFASQRPIYGFVWALIAAINVMISCVNFDVATERR